MMVKHFCDRCHKELAGNEAVFVDVCIRRGLPRTNFTQELCRDCVDKTFGYGFTTRCEAEYAEKQKDMQERRAARMAKKNEQED